MFQPEERLIIIGGGIIGLMEAFHAYAQAEKQGRKIHIDIYEKNTSLADTTTQHIFPSLAPDDMLLVVPRGKQLVENLQHLFSEPGGIQIADVAGTTNSITAQNFIAAVQRHSNEQDNIEYDAQTEALLQLGCMSMQLWKNFYDNADDALKRILQESNFHPCCEPTTPFQPALYDGYRIDLIYDMPNAITQAQAMQLAYQQLNYQHCKILSPDEVKMLDPFLTHFCDSHSYQNGAGQHCWYDDTVALWRPGGCIDTQVFLPKFRDYLTSKMGENIQFKFGQKVENIIVETQNEDLFIKGLCIEEHGQLNQHIVTDQNSIYVFCPGEAVGTLHRLGLDEPPCARFAGASLILDIPIPQHLIEHYATFNHYMEVQQEGVVLAWQARFMEGIVRIGVGGTKGFYGDVVPNEMEDFAKNRNLLQLNMMNDVLPDLVSLALNRNTLGQSLTEYDLQILQDKKIAQRWVGTRAVAYDGVPTVGKAFYAGQEISNARVTTHLSSGGVSLALGIVPISRYALNEDQNDLPNVLAKKILHYGSALRE